jgi:type I restriction enzyme R subunit
VKSLSLQQLLERAATFTITADETATLASRLSRLERELTAKEEAEITVIAGTPLASITKGLITITDPDVLASIEAGAPKKPDGTPDVATATRDYISKIIEPLAGNAALRTRLLEIRDSHDRIIDEVSVDILLDAGGVIDYDKCREVITSWKGFLEENRSEITLIDVLYRQDKSAAITFAELRDLADKIAAPPRSWTIAVIWKAYETLDAEHVKKTDRHTATDLITLIRYTLEVERELVPYAVTVEDRYTNWLAQQAQNGVLFNEMQRWWLDRIKDTIIQSTRLAIEDLDKAPFTERGGVDGAGAAFGTQASALIADLNSSLAA